MPSYAIVICMKIDDSEWKICGSLCDFLVALLRALTMFLA
jgi:hypothetical protein